MDLINLLSTEQGVDINNLALLIETLNEKIMLIDNTVKFHFQIYWSFTTAVIAIIGIINWVVLKKHLEHKAEEYISMRLEDIVSKIEKYKTISGKKYLHDIEYSDGVYSFEIGSDRFNVMFKGTDNKIDIRPIKGQDNLDYTAEVINGKLRIKFKNYNKEEHKGIEWRITYLDV